MTVALGESAAASIAHLAFGSLLLRRRKLFENRLVAFGNTDASQLLDSAQILLFVRSAERNRDTVLAGAGRTSNAVYERFRDIGQVVVEHMRHIVHIDSTGGDVGRHQHANLFTLEVA